jgi:mRNA interferase MazF
VICNFGDVVVVPFPFVDRPIVKRRPALVLSGREFNGSNGHSLFLMITTGAGSHWPSDREIGDGDSTGLSHPSLIRWKAFTLPNQAILRRIGRLAAADLSSIEEQVRVSLAVA